MTTGRTVGLVALPLTEPSNAAAMRPTSMAWLSANAVDLAYGFALPVIWAIGHSFGGIEEDARIYMGRALADLDPGGVGRDIMFALDGQSSFSLFRILANTLAAHLGLSPAVALLSITNLIAWFAATAVFVRAVVPGRAGALVLAAVCFLPRPYTPWNLLAAGEAIAIPRPLAEAGVLLALAALCHGRHLAAALCLAGAALFHPIMAAPGFGILLVVLGRRDWRWFAAAAAVGAAVVVAGAMGAPVASRLTATMDADWRSVLLQRNIYLFVHMWPVDGAGFIAIQAATIVIGAVWLPPRARLIFHVALGVAALGCLVSFVLGDGLADLLVMQAQLWRALWLPAVLAPVAAGLCLLHLPSSGPTGRIALAALCLAWASLEMWPIAPVAAGLAVVACFGGPRLPLTLSRPSVLAAVCVCMILAALSVAGSLAALRTIILGMPAAVDATWNMIWRLKLAMVPGTALAYAVWCWPRSAPIRIAATVALAGAMTLLVTRWDIRTPARADADSGALKPDLVTMLSPRPGEVLWLDGDDGWYWAHRPNWNGATQGAGIVFSRELAMKWRERTLAMLDAGLATGWMREPGRYPVPSEAIRLDADKVTAFCRRSDAPAWIVASLDQGAEPPSGLGASVWTPNLAHWKSYVGAQDIRWRDLDRYAVIPCGAPHADG